MTMGVLGACEKDFLERPPKDTMVDANFYKTNDQILAGTAALYSVVWKDYSDKALIGLGDLRGGTVYRAWNDRDHVLFNTTAVSPQNGEAYRSFYNVVGQANMAIHNINTYAGDAVTEDIRNHAIAEARFMRATAYTYLVMNYGEVPIIENNLDYLSDSSLTKHTVESIWEFITRDYLFAAANLSVTPLEPGRVTQASAEGMLARTYLTRAGVSSVGGVKDQEYLNKAKEYAEKVITGSGKTLLQDYADLFRFPYDNNNESLFELQWVFTTDYGAANTMVSQITYSNDIANGDGWGGDLGASYWMLSLYDGLIKENGDPGFTLDKRLKATFMLPGFHYPEISQTVRDEAGVASEQELIFPAPANDAETSFASPKKYVVGKAADLQAHGGNAITQRYPNNTYMLRLAEIYLIYAEASLDNGGKTTDPKAIEYFNAVHERAGLPAHTGELTWDDIYHERMREFAMEGMSWYDLVRLHYFNPQKAYDIVNSQDRGLYVVIPNQWPNPTAWTVEKNLDAVEERNANASPGNFLLPIPASEASQAPNLRKPAVPYEFGEE